MHGFIRPTQRVRAPEMAASSKDRDKQKTPKKKPRKKTQAERADVYKLYQESVQCVEAEIDFVDATFRELRARPARYLREDFCGTGNTSCEWVRRHEDKHAVGVDTDADVLAWGERNNLARLDPGERARVTLLNADVLEAQTRPMDIVLAMNFSYWCFTERQTMKRYFRRVRESLVSDGVFFLDAYGGWESQQVMRERTKMKRFTYIWNQAAYNPITGEYKTAIEFKFPDGSRIKPAFTYTWRLWSLPELRELLAEAGFARIQVWWQRDEDEDGEDHEAAEEFYPTEEAESDPAWVCYITAEA